MLSVAAVLLLLRGAAAAPAPAARHQRMSAKHAAARVATDAYLTERRAALAAAGGGAGAAAACPCGNASLCAPIGGAPVAEREFYGFGGDDFEWFEWDYVTTVAWGANANLTCAAHAHGARVVMAAPATLLTDNTTAQTEWAEAALADVADGLYDGVVFDFEDPLPARGDGARQYAELIAETKRVFAASNPSLQVSTCVAWSPDDIDGRGYDIVDMCAASDLCYVMDYDTRSQVFTQCLASANAPLPGAIYGIGRYLDLGVPASKLVLGVPWYGYRYECLAGTPADAVYCPISFVPFRGVNCSDAAGSEMPYAFIGGALINAVASGWDESMSAPWMNLIEGSNVTVQYWYDDPRSLSLKYAFAKQAGLRGVGPFTWDDLDIAYFPDQAAMWGAFASFL